MSASSEIFKRALNLYEESYQEFEYAQSNEALAKLILAKCNKLTYQRGVEDFKQESEYAAITLIIDGIITVEQVIYELLEDEVPMEEIYPTPSGDYLEEELFYTLRDVEEELLTECWNATFIQGTWTFTNEGTPLEGVIPHRYDRDGWFVRGTERISVNDAIDILASNYSNFITIWVGYFTKTIYINTTTQEWIEALQIDPTDQQAVEQTLKRMRHFLMGE